MLYVFVKAYLVERVDTLRFLLNYKLLNRLEETPEFEYPSEKAIKSDWPRYRRESLCISNWRN